MGRIVGLVLTLVILGVTALFLRDPIVAWWDAREPADEPSAALAERAERKLEALARDGTNRVALGEAELQSLLLYRYASLLPEFVSAPSIRVGAGQVRLHARLPTERFTRLNDLGAVGGLLPDTADVVLSGQLVTLPGGGAAIAIDEVSAARIPLPRRLIAPALEQLGRPQLAGLPADAVPLPMPPGATAVYVRGDSVILIGRGGSAVAP